MVIDLYPNTGHHYIFLPQLPDTDLPEAIEQECISDRSPWKEWSSGEDTRKYVRWRFGSRRDLTGAGQDERGVWCVVETNTGGVERGTIYETRREIQPVPVQGNETRSPYHSEHPANRENTQFIFDHEGKVYFEMLELRWPNAAGRPLLVDLVVDFGNSRTTAVFIETPEKQLVGRPAELRDILRPVVLIPRATEHQALSDDLSQHADRMVIDSWFVLQEPTFSQFEPPHLAVRESVRQVEIKLHRSGWFGAGTPHVMAEIHRVPQMFVELAPVVLGTEAGIELSSFNFEHGGNVFLSSPKRYAWDNDPVLNPFWHMVPNRWSPEVQQTSGYITPLLSATALRFMPERVTIPYDAEEEWDINAPPNENANAALRPAAGPNEPIFPRSDTIVWVALAIIENAHRQFSSDAHRRNDQLFTERKLRSITVTFPPGWTELEKRAYRRKWQTAINIYTLGHLANRGERPDLYMDVDEAFASQLPIIYGEMMKMGGAGEGWIELVGRGKGKEARVRVLSIDVGGGTTDYSVIEYRDELPGQGVVLRSTLLFKDSSSMAGDMLVKNLIESVVLPGLGAGLGSSSREAFDRLFNGPRGQQRVKEEWKRVVRRILVPKAVQILAALAAGKVEPLADNKASSGLPLWDDSDIQHLNAIAQEKGLPPNIFNSESPVSYRIEDVEECVRRTFSQLFNSLAKFVTVFQVDLVVASGKPTELPEVQRMLEKALPLLPSRILHTKGYEVGSWYPFRTPDGRIFDAKTVTATGAALYRAIKQRCIPGWNIHFEEGRVRIKRNLWVALSANRAGQTSYLNRSQDENSELMLIGTRIGRKLLVNQDAEPVYILCWRDPDCDWSVGPIRVTLRRQVMGKGGVVPSTGGPPAADDSSAVSEYLEISAADGVVQDPNGNDVPVSADDLLLKPCTLENSNFWMDDPNFQVDWRFYEQMLAPL